MKTRPNPLLTGAVCTMLALGACASSENVRQLAFLKAKCAAGDQIFCRMVPYQEETNHQEALENAGKVAGLAVLIPLAVLGAAAEERSSQCYNPWRHRYFYC